LFIVIVIRHPFELGIGIGKNTSHGVIDVIIDSIVLTPVVSCLSLSLSTRGPIVTGCIDLGSIIKAKEVQADALCDFDTGKVQLMFLPGQCDVGSKALGLFSRGDNVGHHSLLFVGRIIRQPTGSCVLAID
jgi:hypothetical protein